MIGLVFSSILRNDKSQNNTFINHFSFSFLMLTKKQYQQIRDELDTCKKPLFFFHDDADGLCSFLLFYRYVKEGKGVIIKTTPRIDEKFVRKVEEYDPDKIFILDIAVVEQEFIDSVKQKVVWIDHHQPLDRERVLYFNPRVNNQGDNFPVAYICYKVVQQDLWIAMTGCVGDWFFPDFADEFKDQFPDLLPKKIDDPEGALFHSRIGSLVNMVQFSLKGKTSDVMKSVRIMTRIGSPYEVLDQTTPAGRFIFKRFSVINKDYEKLRARALKQKPKGDLFLFMYPHETYSFTKELSNELLHLKPKKIILIAREKGDEVKISLRSKKFVVLQLLNQALIGVRGFGGGHEHACGGNIQKDDFDQFVDQLVNASKESKSL